MTERESSVKVVMGGDEESEIMVREVKIGMTYAGKADTFVTIKDPKTRQVLCNLKNPHVPIRQNHNRRQKFIDLEDNVNKNERPHFGLLFQYDYAEKTDGWL